ncbi:uncharacterized protein BP5553_02418 [Venustampulla echinocandica]|uniref:Uncharacterized protein n=1 Tax=Venustampulla echinocandica TaxID=2656787 RepID=A0A370U3U2_9HELO|nr:uncharacterized protein BP5553_02418 [Venustampulla echinocandica]RDL42439.1 hypothetical protein BP5553_02418 [Venustampulla echinocandica]
MVCCSYRGYWTSRGRPSETGIAKDAAAALKWIKQQHDSELSGRDDGEVPVVLWGQSIGAGVAANLGAAKQHFLQGLVLRALILETPFLSIRAMLETLYPQKWLPYKYLWPFLRNHFDTPRALGLIKQGFDPKTPRILILEAGRDELVPSSHGEMLEARCLELGLDVKKKAVHSALHQEAMVRQGGIETVVDTIQEAAQETQEPEGTKKI